MVADLDVQGQVRFRFGRRDQRMLFKHKDETTRHLLLKAAAFGMFYREHENLTFDTKVRFKYPADLAALDLAGDPTFWVVVDDLNPNRLEAVCRHVHAPIALVLQVPDLETIVSTLRRAIHYRYTHGHLRVYNFVMPVEEWLDPENVLIPDASYDVFHF